MSGRSWGDFEFMVRGTSILVSSTSKQNSSHIEEAYWRVILRQFLGISTAADPRINSSDLTTNFTGHHTSHKVDTVF